MGLKDREHSQIRNDIIFALEKAFVKLAFKPRYENVEQHKSNFYNFVKTKLKNEAEKIFICKDLKRGLIVVQNNFNGGHSEVDYQLALILLNIIWVLQCYFDN